MNKNNRRPSLRTVANLEDYRNKSYLRDLKQNYAKRKDSIEIIKSNNELILALRALTEQLVKCGGQI